MTKLKKAESLKEAVRMLNPKHSLTPNEKDFFLERSNSPRKEIINMLSGNDTNAKILFTGHRGSGKSTELNWIAGDENIGREYFVISFLINDYINPQTADIVDIMITLADRIRHEIIENLKVEISKDVDKQLDGWADTITKTKTYMESAETEAGVGINYIFAWLKGRVKIGYESNNEFKRELKPRIANLWNALNDLIIYAQNKSGKKILVIIDDLDKMDIKTAEDLFYNNVSSLVNPCCAIIYTIPIALCRSVNCTQVYSYFNAHFILPNLGVFKKINGKEERDVDVINIIKCMVFKRMDSGLFENEKLVEPLIEKSGGLVFQLINLLMNAANKASAQGKQKISEQEINLVLNDLLSDYIRLLHSRDEINYLFQIWKSKSIANLSDTALVMKLLHQLLVLEYRNDVVWYNIHPILFDYIADKKKDAAE